MRKWLLMGLLSLNLCGFAQTISSYQFAGVQVPPPLPVQNVQELYWGKLVDDPYRFLEQVKDPAVVAWMRSQADATDAILKTLPGRQSILATLKEKDSLGGTVISGIQRTKGNRWFYLKRLQGQSQATLVWRDGQNGEEKLLVDPEALTKQTGKPHAIQSFHPSSDGKLLAYGMHASGSEIGNMYVIDVATGQAVVAPIDRIRFAGVSWRENNAGLFFSRLRPGYETLKSTERFADTGRYYLDLKQPNPDRLIFNASMYPQLKLPSFATGGVAELPGSDLAAMVVYFGVDRRLAMYVAKMDDVLIGKAQWRVVFNQSDDVREVDFGHGYVYLRSALNAPRFKVLRLKVPELSMDKAATILPESEGVLRAMSVAKDALYVTRREGVNTSLLRLVPSPGPSTNVDLQKVPLPQIFPT